MDHRLACLHEILQETRARDLRVAEATRCDEVLSTEVLDVGMVRIEAGWRPFQGLALEFDLRSKDGLPSIGLVDDSIPDFLEDPRLRMPDAGMDAALPGLQVEKVAWCHMLRRSCLVVPEVDPDMGLVRALVRREPNIPVNPGDGSAERPGVPDDVGTDLLQAVPGVADETHGRLVPHRQELYHAT